MLAWKDRSIYNTISDGRNVFKEKLTLAPDFSYHCSG